MKKILLSLLLTTTTIIPVFADLPALTAEKTEISSKNGSRVYVPFILTIPGNGYIYANPKGPGTGKPLSLKVDPPLMRSDKIMIDHPERYIPESENLFVWIYREKLRIYLPVRVSDKTIKLSVNGLFCSSEGRCTPFSSSAFVKIISGDTAAPESLLRANSTIPFGRDPAEKYSGATIIDTSSLRIDKNTVQKNTAVTPTDDNAKSGEVAPGSLPVFSPSFLSRDVSGIIQALIFGLLAGFFLNFMPCVLPVLSLKIMTLVSHGHNRSEIVKTGSAYTGGVLFSFLILAALSSFAGYSWGSLFQKTWFLLLMILIIFSLSLSLFGVYDMGIPRFAGKAASKSVSNSIADSFMKGSLAALLATPCSGPLLGATLAWSLSRSPLEIFAVFISIGVGMSLPYIAIIIRPSLVSKFPKPGNWMIYLERTMGFLLAGSVIYFLSILSEEKLIPSLVMLLVAALALWQYGIWGNLTRTPGSRLISGLLLVGFLVLAFLLPITFGPKTAAGLFKTEIYSHELLLNRSAAGMTAVQFTADWCPNCRVVERSSLLTEETSRLFRKHNITLLVADITQQGTQGEELLHKLGSQSIPFLAFFPRGERFTKPVCIRDLYTTDDIRKAIERTRAFHE